MSTDPVQSISSAVTSSSASGSTTPSAASANNSDPLKGLDLKSFLNLMIAELQNQDPMNPLDNSQLLNQLGEMAQIDATSKLSTTLDSVLLGQSLTNASSLIGRNITALDDNGKDVSGMVDKATLAKGVAKLQVGDAIVSLSNISEISPPQ